MKYSSTYTYDTSTSPKTMFLSSSWETCPGDSQETFKRHPGGAQETPRRPRRHLGGTQEDQGRKTLRIIICAYDLERIWQVGKKLAHMRKDSDMSDDFHSFSQGQILQPPCWCESDEGGHHQVHSIAAKVGFPVRRADHSPVQGAFTNTVRSPLAEATLGETNQMISLSLSLSSYTYITYI